MNEHTCEQHFMQEFANGGMVEDYLGVYSQWRRQVRGGTSTPENFQKTWNSPRLSQQPQYQEKIQMFVNFLNFMEIF